jgi:predicted nucleic-acid-binding protein
MIGLDTNILVRYFIQDDPEQTRLAVNLIDSLSPTKSGWIGVAVFMELDWVLNNVLKVKKDRVVEIFDTLLVSQELVVENANTVREALQLYRSRNTDFSDCLIASAAKAAGCSRIVTFDRIAARDAGMVLIE